MADGARGSRWSLRTRVVAVATILVTVVLVVGGLLLGLRLRQVMIGDVREATLVRANDLAALAGSGQLPSPVPVGDADEALVQVVAQGRVVAASSNADRIPPLDVPVPPPGESRVTEVRGLPLEDEADERFVVATVTLTGQDGPVTIHVASSLEDIAETLGQALNVAVLGLPLLIGVLAGVVWLLVGRTLAPVETIRQRADGIDGRRLGQRVPVPPSDDEIARLARTLNRMLGRIEAASDRQRRFVADAAHELRTPIATMRARLETAAGSPRRIDWDEVAADLLAETARMQRLTEQLLLLARADAGTLAATNAPVDLDDLLVAVAADGGRGVPGGSQEPVVDVSAVEPAQVRGDPVLLEQAIRNLVDNARRHAAGRIALSCMRDGATAVLIVDDDGPGIADDHREAVFERFTRLDAARASQQGGAGLGLAIVADIAAAHGGTVVVDASPLGGARFVLRLPLGDQEQPG